MTTENSDDDGYFVVTVHPPSFYRMLAALRRLDTANMKLSEVVAACEAVIPGIDLERIGEALSIIGAERYEAAKAARRARLK
jgi:hypothetical protein